MAGFNPAWFVAVGIGVLLLAADFLLPDTYRRKGGYVLLTVAVVFIGVGLAGLGYDYFHRESAPVQQQTQTQQNSGDNNTNTQQQSSGNSSPNVSAPNGVAVGRDNYGNPKVVNNYGPKLPPPRLLKATKLKELSASLESAKESKVAIDAFVDGDAEVSELTDQLEKAFNDGKWTVTKVTKSLSGAFAGAPAMPDNVLICGAPDKDTKAASTAIKSLGSVGLKCDFLQGYTSPFSQYPASAATLVTPDVVIVIRKRVPKKN